MKVSLLTGQSQAPNLHPRPPLTPSLLFDFRETPYHVSEAMANGTSIPDQDDEGRDTLTSLKV